MRPALGRIAALVSLCAALVACAPQTSLPVVSMPGTASATMAPLPTFANMANSDLARNFLDLTYQLETGQTLERLLRYEVPVTVSLHPSLTGYQGDLDALLGLLRSEARIDIRSTRPGQPATLRVEPVPAAEFARAAPGAACFVAPAVSSWAEYRSGPRQRWTLLQGLGNAAIFLPDTAPPLQVRACLHEEISQALGPVNDLYRLHDTIWNDDNIHLNITAHDLMILRVLYDPALQNGLGRAETARRLPDILARANPRGERNPPRPLADFPEWDRAIAAVLNSPSARPAAAESALALARSISPPDHRLAISLMAAGRTRMGSDPAGARAAFVEAHSLSLALLGPNNLRSAQAALHLAYSYSVTGDDPQAVLDLVDTVMGPARAEDESAMMAAALGLRAMALARLGQDAAARAAWVDSRALASYAFGATEPPFAVGLADGLQ